MKSFRKIFQRNNTHYALYICCIIGSMLNSLSCKETITPPQEPKPVKWNVVPVLASLDVRYMIQGQGTLYLTAVDPSVKETETINGRTYYKGDRSVIYTTTDAVTWTKIKGFRMEVGPMTYHDDTLYCLASDSIYRLLPGGEWQTAFATPTRLGDASADGDMTFIGENLYAMQTVFGNAVETYRIHPDGLYEEVTFARPGIHSYAGAKFIKVICNSLEKIFMRPQWNAGLFFIFDGYEFTSLINGLIEEELHSAPSDAMRVRNDTLYAGFGGDTSPGTIKVLLTDQWIQFGDTLPYWHFAYQVTPVLRAQPTAIAFSHERIFVATNSVGVLESKNGKGWMQMSDGLIPGYIPNIDNKDLYRPLPFLEYFKDKLIAAYGKPGYGPWGGVGVYIYDLNQKQFQ